jgi:tRNA A37 methylthiotransferase MiaB
VKRFHITDNNVCVPYKLILGRLHNHYRQNGFQPVSNPDQADLIVMGCCGSFHSMEQAALEKLKSLRRIPSAELVAFGCLVRISPHKVAALRPDRMVSSPQWKKLADMLPAGSRPLTATPYPNEFTSPSEYRRYDPRRKFVLIQTGCSSNCPHCPHKLGIGELESLPMDEIMRQASQCVASGAREVIVHGNDTGAYGTDRGGPTYPDLIEGLLALPVDLYLSQINADWAYQYRHRFERLIEDPKIKELQILIQSSSDRLLTLMARRPVVMGLEPLLTRVREKRPDIMLRTDLIIGYPTSTAAEDRLSTKFAGAYFDEIAVHAFELFPQTPIAGMDLDHHPLEVIRERMAEAVDYLETANDRVVHRGGQNYTLLEEIEALKESIRNKKTTAGPTKQSA